MVWKGNQYSGGRISSGFQTFGERAFSLKYGSRFHTGSLLILRGTEGAIRCICTPKPPRTHTNFHKPSVMSACQVIGVWQSHSVFSGCLGCARSAAKWHKPRVFSISSISPKCHPKRLCSQCNLCSKLPAQFS